MMHFPSRESKHLIHHFELCYTNKFRREFRASSSVIYFSVGDSGVVRSFYAYNSAQECNVIRIDSGYLRSGQRE